MGIVATYTSAPATTPVMEKYFALWIRRGNVAWTQPAGENTFPTLGVRLSKQMSHEWRSVLVSFAIKDGLSCGRGVQLPTVRFAVLIWICHGVSFGRRSVRQSQVTSPAAFPSQALWLAIADPHKWSHFCSIVSDLKRKNNIQCFHPSSHSTACCVFCGDFCFIRCSEEQAPPLLWVPRTASTPW